MCTNHKALKSVVAACSSEIDRAIANSQRHASAYLTESNVRSAGCDADCADRLSTSTFIFVVESQVSMS